MLRGIPLLLAPVLLAASAFGQPLPGDWIVDGYDRPPPPPNNQPSRAWLQRVIPATGAVSTIIETPYVMGTAQRLDVVMAPNNVDLASAIDLVGNPSQFQIVSPSGTILTTVNLPGQVFGHDLDQDGTFAGCGGSGEIYRIDPANGSVTLLQRVNGLAFYDVRVDQDTGDLLISANSDLLRVARVSGIVTTLTQLLARGIDFEPRTGSLVCTPAGNGIRRVSRAGIVTTVHATFPSSGQGIVVDDVTGDLVVVSSAQVGQVTAGGALVTSYALPSTYRMNGVELYGSRKVSGSGPATGGSLYTLDFAFPSSPGANYAAALSTGLRPGIALADGRVINLDFTSPLFLLSLGGLPGITTGFAGVLDAAGRAAGTVLVLPNLPVGTRFFASAIAVNPALPLGLETANTWAFSTN